MSAAFGQIARPESALRRMRLRPQGEPLNLLAVAAAGNRDKRPERVLKPSLSDRQEE